MQGERQRGDEERRESNGGERREKMIRRTKRRWKEWKSTKEGRKEGSERRMKGRNVCTLKKDK